MSSTTSTDTSATSSSATSIGTVAFTRRFRAALAGEWIKLRSLRSMPATLTLTAVFCIGLATLVCSNYAADWTRFSAERRAAFDPTDTNLGFLQLGMLFFGALGALVVTNEYGNGLIRTTFAATPQRSLVFAAKTVLLGALAFAASTVIVFAAFFAGQSMLTGGAPHAGLGDPGVLGQVWGGVFYMTAVGLTGLFLGALTRSTAVAVSGLFAVFLVLPIMVDNLPHGPLWRHIVPYLPSNVGNVLWHTHGDTFVSRGAAMILLPVYVAVLGALSVIALRRRDA